MELTNFTLSDDVLASLEALWHSKSNEKNIKISVATCLFTSKSVSLARAAEIAELSLADYIKTLSKNNISWSTLTESELAMDSEFISSLTKENSK